MIKKATFLNLLWIIDFNINKMFKKKPLIFKSSLKNKEIVLKITYQDKTFLQNKCNNHYLLHKNNNKINICNQDSNQKDNQQAQIMSN